MKRIKMYLLGICLLIGSVQSRAQSFEVQQLLLNWEKLSQLKNILQQMKEGYNVISRGYNSVKNIANGNFNLHEAFIDGLLLVNPEIKKYGRVKEIIEYQAKIVSEYRSAFRTFKRSGNFSESNLKYFGSVYDLLLKQSLNNLDDLTSVITSSDLRMSDEERLKAIDRIFVDTQDKLVFLRYFNRQCSLLNLQLAKEKADIQSLQQLYP